MVLSIKNLSKRFKNNIILEDVSLEVKEGEIVVIVGPSGAGKTTLLRCITGLEKFEEGAIEVDGEPISRHTTRKIGMVFQNFNLFPHMSVIENIIEAPIQVLGLTKQQAKSRAINILKRLGLEDKASSYPFELSGGQKQRAAIARACALSPKVMAFDEPTSALDPSLTEEIASIIQDLAKEKMAVLVITHDRAFAKRIATRTIEIYSGKIKLENTVGYPI